jgi:hypothetical protein
VSHRPLALVSGLTLGDYLLWNWSLGGSHDVLALVSGLTLPPLAVVFVWLIVLTVARLIAHATRDSRAQRDQRRHGQRGVARGTGASGGTGASRAARASGDDLPASASSPDKLAA